MKTIKTRNTRFYICQKILESDWKHQRELQRVCLQSGVCINVEKLVERSLYIKSDTQASCLFTRGSCYFRFGFFC